MNVSKPVEFVFEEITNGESRYPTMKFAGEQARDFFPALQESMIRSGYSRPKRDESLEAIKYHLEDMRKLVFEEKK